LYTMVPGLMPTLLVNRRQQFRRVDRVFQRGRRPVLSDLRNEARLMPAPAMTECSSTASGRASSLLLLPEVENAALRAAAELANGATSVSLSRPRRQVGNQCRQAGVQHRGRPASSCGSKARRGRPTSGCRIRDLGPVDFDEPRAGLDQPRPSRQHWPNRVLRAGRGSRRFPCPRSKALRARPEITSPSDLAVVVVDVVLGNGFFPIGPFLGDGVAPGSNRRSNRSEEISCRSCRSSTVMRSILFRSCRRRRVKLYGS